MPLGETPREGPQIIRVLPPPPSLLGRTFLVSILFAMVLFNVWLPGLRRKDDVPAETRLRAALAITAVCVVAWTGLYFWLRHRRDRYAAQREKMMHGQLLSDTIASPSGSFSLATSLSWEQPLPSSDIVRAKLLQDVAVDARRAQVLCVGVMNWPRASGTSR